MKVVICSPVYDHTKTRFTSSLFKLTNWTARQSVIYNGLSTIPDLAWAWVGGASNLAVAREQLAEAAVAEGADYLLWLDADQAFPHDTLFRLAAHDLPIVGANYMRRGGGGSVAGKVVDGVGMPVEPKSDGLEPVDVIGFGVLLIKADVFRALPKPWFSMSPTCGEDAHFCQLARDHGIQPYVDHALSMEVGHIAETVLQFSASLDQVRKRELP